MRLLVLAAVLVLAVAPSWGTLGAPLVAEDAAILGHVHRDGAWADWLRPQYGLTTLRFWRPLVSLVWDVQEGWTGIAPGPLRAWNLACHVAAALLLVALARELGCGWLGALAAGGLAATFPEQGGTLTWIAGRTDGTCSPLVVLALWLVAAAARGPERPGGGRPGAWAALAGLVAFLACAAKEMAFVLPAWAFALALAGGNGASAGGGRAARRSRLLAAAAASAGVAVALLWRRAALGSWLGGYPAPAGELAAALPTAIATWARAAGPSLAAALLLLPLGLLLGTARPRLWAAGMVAAVTGALPLYSMLSQGVLEATNLRVLRISDLGLALAVAGALASTARSGWRNATALALLLALLAWRGVRAHQDTHEWAEAGRVASAAIEAGRARVAGEPPSPHPVLGAALPPVHGGAYCLSLGVAERFRPPFPPAPRPVWPLRRMFPAGAGERRPVRAGAGPWHDPLGDPWPAGVARIELELPPGGPDGAVLVDESVAREPDRSPVLGVRGSFPGARLELVLWTELGYEPVPWPAPAGDERRELSLRAALLCHGFVSLGEALLLTADLGAARAYLEVRAVDAQGELVASSEWVALVWERDLLERLAPVIGG